MAYRQLNTALLNKQSGLWLLLLLFNTAVLHAQLPNFTLVITNTAETCPGNGTLTFNAQGTDPAATISYSIFQLPDTTSPISVLS
ncbi:MAG TPA: hypothetical protein VK476_07460, partial [Flavobacterium sp.]|nr:hypothetical protein [Flavobacterium sp.]